MLKGLWIYSSTYIHVPGYFKCESLLRQVYTVGLADLFGEDFAKIMLK